MGEKGKRGGGQTNRQTETEGQRYVDAHTRQCIHTELEGKRGRERRGRGRERDRGQRRERGEERKMGRGEREK